MNADGPETPTWTKVTGETAFNFDTTGGTQHVQNSRQTIARYPTNTANLNGLINVTADKVDGVDIVVPAFAFTVTRYMSIGDLDSTFINNLYALTGRVNNADITMVVDGLTLSFLHGELLFMGASGARRGGGDVEVSFRFAGSPNVVNQTVGTINGINKKGWEYAWVRTRQTTTSYIPAVGAMGTNSVDLVTLTPDGVYVEQLYLEGNFALLGIPNH